MTREIRRRMTVSATAILFAALATLGVACGPPGPDPVATQAVETVSTSPADSGLFCDEHGVPEAYCTLCHEELKGTLLLCAEHGNIPEDICTLCHPEVEAKHKIVMCPKGHKLPKHFCYECAKPAGP